MSQIPKQSGGNFLNSDISFIKSYFKPKISYGKEANIDSSEFDVSKKQTNLRGFQIVNKEKKKNYKYDYNKHKDRIIGFLGEEKAKFLIEDQVTFGEDKITHWGSFIDQINEYAVQNPIN